MGASALPDLRFVAGSISRNSLASGLNRGLSRNGTQFVLKVAVTLCVTNANCRVLRPASLGEVEKKSKRRFFDLGLLVGMR